MITITISDEKLQETFDNAFNKMLEVGNYENPIKKALDNILGYNGDKEVKAAIEQAVKEHVINAMASPHFALALGNAMAAEIAKREVDKLKR